MLFGDEPTGALNSTAANEVMEILNEINQAKTTIMLVTHDIKVAAKTERILDMRDDVIVGEKYLGKWQKEGDLKNRESQLSIWLAKMEF